MTIEFRCTSCEKLLRTQPGTEGKKAKCPQCGTVLTIPSASAAAQPPDAPSPFESPSSFEAPPPRDPDFAGSQAAMPPPGDNPYQAPSAYTTTHVQRGYHPTRIELGEIFSRTWQIFKDNLGACIAGALLFFGCNFFINMIIGFAFIPVTLNLQGNDGALILVNLLQQFVGQAVSTFFFIGMILFMLRIARGEGADFGSLFAGGPFFLYGVVLQIIVNLAMIVGFIFLIIPGIIIGLMLSQAMFIFVDQRAGIGDSLRLSIEAMKGNKLTVFAIWILAMILGLAITVLTCLIGGLFVGPFVMLMMSVIYLGVTGQRTALDGPAQPQAERGFDAPGAQPI